MIDFHTHLDLYPDAMEIIKKANRVNRFTLAVTTSPRAWIASSKVFSGYRNVEVALGLHPEIINEKFNELDLLLDSISNTAYIGEVGLDGTEKLAKTMNEQEKVFESTIKKCQHVGGRIVSIHSRSAASKVISILRKYPDCGTQILHWFSGSLAELKKAIEMRCYFSINPVMAYSKKGKALISEIPKNLVLPESDGPFTKRMGKLIMPWEAMSISLPLSEVWSLPQLETEKILVRNFEKILCKNDVSRT